MAEMGHEDAFPRPRLSARYRFSQGTFAEPRGNGRDAPKAATREVTLNDHLPYAAPACAGSGKCTS